MRAVAAALILVTFGVAPASAFCNHGHYVNVSGHVVPTPECALPSQHLAHETAVCRDGSHSFSEHRSGTCSHHGGVDHFD